MGNVIYSEVKAYTHCLWTQELPEWGEARVRGKLNCFGDGFMLLMLFVDDGDPVPPAKVHHWKRKEKIDLYIPFSKMHCFVDLLRHEKHVFAHIDIDHPEHTHLTTDREHLHDDD